MSIWQALILGIVEGLTEFLPVSSTAHMLIAEEILGISANATTFTFTVLVQLGAIFALVIYFWKDFWELAKALFKGLSARKPFETEEARLAWLVGLACLPTLGVAFLLRDLVTELFTDPLLGAGLRLVVTAAILVVAEVFSHPKRSLSALTWLDALWIGMVQILTVLPGSSRSGAAIVGGMTRGFDRPSAARFAFLMSLPIMLVAGVYETAGALNRETLSFLPVILVGLVAAGVSGWYSIRWLVNYVSRRSLYPFAMYCLLLGGICFAVFFIR